MLKWYYICEEDKNKLDRISTRLLNDRVLTPDQRCDLGKIIDSIVRDLIPETEEEIDP